LKRKEKNDNRAPLEMKKGTKKGECLKRRQCTEPMFRGQGLILTNMTLKGGRSKKGVEPIERVNWASRLGTGEERRKESAQPQEGKEIDQLLQGGSRPRRRSHAFKE